MKAAFIGHFVPLEQALAAASSIAGNQAQRKIAHELSAQCGADQTICYSMMPHPAWPKGPFLVHSMIEEAVEFIGYLNIPVVKHFVFAWRLLIRLLLRQPRLCIQYNSYLFENLALLLFRVCRPESALAVIIQDIHVEGGGGFFSKQNLRALSERISLLVVRSFNMIIPISAAIVDDFGIQQSKCFVFQGGVTEFAGQLMRVSDAPPLEDIGVFAGGLEPHNGVDRLVTQWIACGVKKPLHIFGRGSLTSRIELAAQESSCIIYHGFQPEQVVLEWQLKARWNFCLRYSIGLNQDYFFPSKFFNILCAPGSVVVNDFHAIPESVRAYLSFISDDLSDLVGCLDAAVLDTEPARVSTRREIVHARHSWSACIGQIISSLLPVDPKC